MANVILSGNSLVVNLDGTVPGTPVRGTISAVSNITGGNILTSGIVSSAGNAIHSNVIATANVQGGNLRTTGTISASGNIYGGNLAVNSGFVSAGNIISAGPITAQNYYGNGSNLTGITGPAFIATQTAYQTIPASPTAITTLNLIYNNVSKNIGGGYNPLNGIFTSPLSGFYQVSASIGVNPFANLSYYGGGALVLFKNSTTSVASGPFILLEYLVVGQAWSAVTSQSSLSTLVYLNAGETIQCRLGYVTNAPGIWTTQTSLVPNSFQACWLRP